MTTKQQDKKQAQIVTPEFRVSFPSVFEARKNDLDPTAKAKFSVTMLFRVKETPESKARGEKVVDIAPLKALVRQAVVDKFGPDQSKWPVKTIAHPTEPGKMLTVSALRLPFRDGKEKDFEGYGDGVIFCSASSVMKPGLVDQNVQPIISPADFYGGAYARATVTAFYYKTKGNEGVSFGLRNIQKIRDGEPFSGRSKPENDFDAIPAPDGATGAAAGGGAGAGDGLFGDIGA